jgi:molybdopterin-guanine dinucleotide biosynthesis protein B
MRIIQTVGYKNAGKTTLVTHLIRDLATMGYRVGSLKHDAHDFEPDVRGTDSWLHRQAGACITAITSPSCTAWVEEKPSSVDELVTAMASRALDYLLIEGFKSAPYPKIVLLRDDEEASAALELLSLPNVIAAVTRMTPSPSIHDSARTLNIPLFSHPDIHSFDPLFRYILAQEQEKFQP